MTDTKRARLTSLMMDVCLQNSKEEYKLTHYFKVTQEGMIIRFYHDNTWFMVEQILGSIKYIKSLPFPDNWAVVETPRETSGPHEKCIRLFIIPGANPAQSGLKPGRYGHFKSDIDIITQV